MFLKEIFCNPPKITFFRFQSILWQQGGHGEDGFWLWLELQLLAIFVQSCHALLSRNLLMVVVLDLILGTDNKNTKKEKGWLACHMYFNSILCFSQKKKLCQLERQRRRLNHHEKLRLLEFHRVFFSSGMSTSLHPDNNFQDPGQLRRHQFPYLG